VSLLLSQPKLQRKKLASNSVELYYASAPVLQTAGTIKFRLASQVIYLIGTFIKQFHVPVN